MKKSLIIAAILALAFTAGCAKNDTANVNDNAAQTNGSADTGSAAQTNGSADAQQSSSDVDNFAANASDNIDMDAVDGEYLQVSADSVGSPSEELGVFEVSIDSAKKFVLDGNTYVVFAIDYANNSSETTTFTSTINALAFQDGMQIAPAALPSLPEGIDTTATMQRVSSGEKITVQKVFKLDDTTTPVELQVSAFYEDTDAVASQIFDLQ